MADDTHVERFVADTREYTRPLREAANEADHFGDRNTAAALAARRMGLAASEAADKAARAQKEAADAAERLAKGELGADEAARRVKESMNALERADIKAAEASLAAGRAANEQADQYKRLAREAELAGGVERLAQLKGAGATQQHNKLLNDLRSDFGGLGRDATKGFEEMEASGQAAFSGIGSMGPVATAAIVAGLALLPAAATLAGGAITVGVGGALAAIGLKATMGSEVAKHALTGLKDYASELMKSIDKPFEQTWVAIATSAKTILGGIAPDLKHDFAAIAPAVSGLATQLGHELPAQMHGFLASIQADFPPIAAELGQVLPGALGRAADGLKQIMDEIGRNPEEFGNMINATGRLVQALGTMVVWLIKVGEAMTTLNKLDGEFGAKLQEVGNKLGPFGFGLRDLGGFMQRLDLSSKDAGNTLTNFASNEATAAAQAGAAATATGRLNQQMDQLDKTIQKILDPSLALSNDTIQLKADQVALTAALKASHGQMGLQTDKTRAASTAFNGLIKQVATVASEQKNLDGNMGRATKTVQDQIQHLWTLAGSNKDAQAQVIRLAEAFNVPLPKSAQKSKGAIDGVHNALTGVKSKTITVTADVSQAVNAARNLQSIINSLVGGKADGGAIMPPFLRADGGPLPQHLAGGGAARYMPFGGPLHGSGTAKSDSIPVWGSTGEYMVKAVSYAANKNLVEAINAANGRPVSLGGQKGGSTLGPGGPKSATLHAMPLARRHYAEALSGSSGGTSRPHVVNNNTYIAGSIWSVDELLNQLQARAFERGIDFNRPAGR